MHVGRKRRNSALRVAVVTMVAAGVLGFMGLTALPVPAEADELSDLKAAVQALQQRVEQLEAERARSDQDIDERIDRVVEARVDQTVGGGDLGMDKTLYGPGSFKLPGTNTSVAIHGYVKSDFTYDFDAAPTFDPLFEPHNLPIAGAAAGRDGEFNAHIKESRLNIVTQTPTEFGLLFTRFEVDAFAAGAASDEVVANGEDIGVRHAYGKLGNVLIGQDWSTYQPVLGFAATLDFSGGNANSFIRQPMIQWSQLFGNGHEWAIAVENPQADIQTQAGVIDNTEGTLQLDQVPDIAARIQSNQPWGSLWLSGVARMIGADTGTGADDEEFGYGLHGLAIYNVTDTDRVAVLGQYGDGIGRYINDLGGTGSDAVFNTLTGEMEALEAWSAGAWYQHWWTDTVRSAAYFGYVQVDNEDIQVGAAFSASRQASANIVWSPIPQVNVGLEFLNGELEVKDGRTADGNRLQASGQYLF